jgi:hypothetical protein
MTLMRTPLHVGSTNDHRLLSWRNTVTGEYPTNGVVSVTLIDLTTNTPVVGAVALEMPYVAGTTGIDTEYRASFPAALPLVAGRNYLARVTAIDIEGNVRNFETDYVGVPG